VAPAPTASALRERLHPVRPPLVPEIVIHVATSGSRLGELAGRRTPYWAYAWPGGCLLARYLLDNPGLAAGRQALDLGAGCGIVAIAAARCGARATAMDLDPLSAEATHLNAQASGVTVDCVTADALAGGVPEAGLLLAGDLFYDARLARRAARFLDLCATAEKTVLVGDIGRAHLPRDRLRQLATYELADFGSGEMRAGGVFAWVATG
jgi:predicted nicotinamide N-methyase